MTPLTSLDKEAFFLTVDGPLGLLPELEKALPAEACVPMTRKRSLAICEMKVAEESAIDTKTLSVFRSRLDLKHQLKFFQTRLYENMSPKSFGFIAEALGKLDYVKEIMWPTLRDSILLESCAHLAVIPFSELDAIHAIINCQIQHLPLKNLREAALKAKALKNLLEKGIASVDLLLCRPQTAYLMALEISFAESDYESFSALFADLDEEKALSFLQTLFEGLLAKKEDPDKLLKLVEHLIYNLEKHYRFINTRLWLGPWLEKARSL
jgi:hypothetical protein